MIIMTKAHAERYAQSARVWGRVIPNESVVTLQKTNGALRYLVTGKNIDPITLDMFLEIIDDRPRVKGTPFGRSFVIRASWVITVRGAK